MAARPIRPPFLLFAFGIWINSWLRTKAMSSTCFQSPRAFNSLMVLPHRVRGHAHSRSVQFLLPFQVEGCSLSLFIQLIIESFRYQRRQRAEILFPIFRCHTRDTSMSILDIPTRRRSRVTNHISPESNSCTTSVTLY